MTDDALPCDPAGDHRTGQTPAVGGETTMPETQSTQPSSAQIPARPRRAASFEDTLGSRGNDLVADAFDRVRQASKRKNGRIPSLKYQAGTGVGASDFGAPGFAGTDSADTIGALLPDVLTRGGTCADDPELAADRARARRPRSWPSFARPSGPDGRAWHPSDRPEKLVSILGREITSRGWKKGLAQGFLTSRWEEIVGEKIAQHTTIEMVKDTTLFLSTDSTAWATNLRLMQRTILSAIAEQVGPGIVTELKIYPPKAPSWRKGRLHVKGRGPRDTYG
ncbi:DciA family protein [Corynebacterium mendelii]